MVNILDELVMFSYKFLICSKSICRFGIFMLLGKVDVFLPNVPFFGFLFILSFRAGRTLRVDASMLLLRLSLLRRAGELSRYREIAHLIIDDS